MNRQTLMELKKSRVLAAIPMLIVTSGLAFSEEPVRIATFNVAGNENLFSELENASNPFHLLNSVCTYQLTILPPARAMNLFCNGEFDLIYPVIDSTVACPSELVQIFSINTNFVHYRPLEQSKSIGLRLGFDYDLELILSYLPEDIKIHYIETDQQMVKMLVAKRLDTILIEENSYSEIIKTLNLSAQKTAFQTPYNQLPVQIAISQEDVSLQEKVHSIFGK